MFVTHLFMAAFAVAIFGHGNCLSIPKEPPIVAGKPTIVEGELPMESSLERLETYYVYSEKKTWDEARISCNDRSMALAYIMTLQEQSDLRYLLIKRNMLPKDEKSGYWLGAKTNEHQEWIWEHAGKNVYNDRQFMAGWHYKKPNHEALKKGALEECMELQFVNNTVFDTSLSWNDIRCDEKRGYICQIPVTK